MTEALARLLAPLRPIGAGAWLVGGGVRDALLGLPVADVDVALEGPVEPAAEALARVHGAGRFRLSERFGSWRVQGGGLGMIVDVSPLQGATLDEDLGRRDLTVNAIAVAIDGDGSLIDPTGGRRDLEGRRLRLVSPGALAADPLRLLRLARLAHQLGFTIDSSARAQARADAWRVDAVAGERLLDELRRMLALPRPSRAIEELDALGVLGALVPELEQGRGLTQNPYHHRDVLGHTLEVVRRADEIVTAPSEVFRSLGPRVAAALERPVGDEFTAGRALLVGALLHDMAKPATRAVTADGRVTFMGHDRRGAEMADSLLRRLKASVRLRERVVLMVREHLPLGFLVHRAPLSLREIDRYLRRTAPAEVELIVLSVADRLATAGPRVRPSAVTRHLALAREVLRVHFELEDRGPIRPPLPGDRIAAALGRAPGPWLGELLADLREEQLVGRVRTESETIRFAERWSANRKEAPGAD